MARGPKKHLKRICAPKSWMLDKLGGIYATRPSQGPHRLRESLPLYVLLKNRLKYALTGREVKVILNDKEANVRVDNRVRQDEGFPTGIMDVVSITKTSEHFRVLYDTKGRFVLKSIKPEEAKFKLIKIRARAMGTNKIPYIVSHDARTFRFPHPEIEANDTVRLNLETNKIEDFIKFETGNVCFVTAGNNIGRVGIVTHIEKHMGSFDIVHVKDANGRTFATRSGNVFIIGKGKKPWISLPRENGIYLTVLEERKRKLSN